MLLGDFDFGAQGVCDGFGERGFLDRERLRVACSADSGDAAFLVAVADGEGGRG